MVDYTETSPDKLERQVQVVISVIKDKKEEVKELDSRLMAEIKAATENIAKLEAEMKILKKSLINDGEPELTVTSNAFQHQNDITVLEI